MSSLSSLPAPNPTRWRLRHGVGLALVILLGIGLGWRGRAREIALLGDEPIYLSLSSSLAAGHYRDEFLAGTPPHAQYPPGLPAWLLGIRSAFGPDLDTARAANFFLLVLTVLLVADLVRRLTTPWAGVAAGTLTMVNPLILRLSGTLYAETLFMALIAVGIWSAHRADESHRRRWPILALAAMLAAFLTRVAGLAPLLGLLAWQLVRRRWGQAAAFAAAGAATVGAWGTYATHASAGSIGRSYGADIARLNLGYLDHVTRIVNALKSYLTGVLPIALEIPTIKGTPVDNAIVVLVLGTLGVLGMVVALRRSTAGAMVLLAYTGMLGFWLWPNTRFLLPVLPWVIATLVVGAHALGSRLGGRLEHVPLIGFLTLLAIPALQADLRRAGEYQDCGARRAQDPASCYPAQDRGYVRATAFIRDSLPEGAIIVGGKPATIYLLTGRRALPGYLASLPDGTPSIAPLLALGASYFLVGPVRAEASPDDGDLQPYFQSACAQLTTVATFAGAFVLAPRTDPHVQADACKDVGGTTTLP